MRWDYLTIGSICKEENVKVNKRRNLFGNQELLELVINFLIVVTLFMIQG